MEDKKFNIQLSFSFYTKTEEKEQEGLHMKESYWVSCPICHSKTRVKIRKDTEMHRFPLFCPKCKQETLVDIKQLQITVIKEPDV